MRLRARLALFIVLGGCLTAQGQTGSPVLELGKKRAYEITTDRSQEHDVLLRAGEYARLHITQLTVNIAVAVLDPPGEQLFHLDNNPHRNTQDVTRDTTSITNH